jgi:hypothetical protein
MCDVCRQHHHPILNQRTYGPLQLLDVLCCRQKNEKKNDNGETNLAIVVVRVYARMETMI